MNLLLSLVEAVAVDVITLLLVVVEVAVSPSLVVLIVGMEHILLSLVLVVPVMALLWVAWQNRSQRPLVVAAGRARDYVTADLPGYRGEITLLMMAGFIGTLIILRPGLQVIEIGALAQLVAAPCFAISFLLAKKLTQQQDSWEILTMLSIYCTLVLLPGALIVWQTPTLMEVAWLLLVAVFATAGHFALTRAFAHAPLTVTQPFGFLQLVWAILFGYLLFDETPDIWVAVGAAIIVTAVTYISHRETMARRVKVKTTPSQPG